MSRGYGAASSKVDRPVSRAPKRRGTCYVTSALRTPTRLRRYFCRGRRDRRPTLEVTYPTGDRGDDLLGGVRRTSGAGLRRDEGLVSDIAQHLAVSCKVEIEDLDWETARTVGLTAQEVESLHYFADIESQTVYYFLEVAK